MLSALFVDLGALRTILYVEDRPRGGQSCRARVMLHGPGGIMYPRLSAYRCVVGFRRACQVAVDAEFFIGSITKICVTTAICRRLA